MSEEEEEEEKNMGGGEEMKVERVRQAFSAVGLK
jgi:hypothetical protein